MPIPSSQSDSSPEGTRRAAELRVGETFGDFELLALVGDGGMGAVYAVRPMRRGIVDRVYALKVPHAYLRDLVEGGAGMLLDEARIASSIRHPNVLSVLSAPTDRSGEIALLMEYVEGASFEWVLKRSRHLGHVLPRPVVLRMLLDGLSGLSAAHRQETLDGRPMRVVHRDIAPGNLFVGLDGMTRLSDFGIAAAADRFVHSIVGSVKGRMAYMAPERIEGAVADSRSDVFAYGVVVWEAFAGERLFRGTNDFTTAERVLALDVPRLADRDPSLAALDAVVAKALARDPRDRHACGDDLLEALEAIAKGLGGVATTRAVERALEPVLREKVLEQREAIREAAAGRARQAHARSTHPGAEPSDETTLPNLEGEKTHVALG